MKDFFLLFQNPKEVFCKERENTSILITLLLFLVTVSVSNWKSIVMAGSGFIDGILKSAHLSSAALLPVVLIFVYLSLVIGVNILYLIMKIFVKGVDHVSVPKKNTKKLVYLAVMLPIIVTNVFDIIFYFVAKTAEPSYLNMIGSVYAALVTAMLLYLILARVVKAKKSANIFPILYLVLNVASLAQDFMS